MLATPRAAEINSPHSCGDMADACRPAAMRTRSEIFRACSGAMWCRLKLKYSATPQRGAATTLILASAIIFQRFPNRLSIRAASFLPTAFTASDTKPFKPAKIPSAIDQPMSPITRTTAAIMLSTPISPARSLSVIMPKLVCYYKLSQAAVKRFSRQRDFLLVRHFW